MTTESPSTSTADYHWGLAESPLSFLHRRGEKSNGNARRRKSVLGSAVEDRDGKNCGYMSWSGYPRDLDQAAVFDVESDAERAAEMMLHSDYGYCIEPTDPL